jgi:hypothetical protein
MQEQEHLGATGEQWIQGRLVQLSRQNEGWAKEMSALEKELSQVYLDIEKWRGSDEQGLVYLKHYGEVLSTRIDSLTRQVREGNYPRFRG